uniref:Uncharacterized protein n=1 Tax=Cacopsylla melanoneura TaxID=428564 RepID=A0A8D8RGJ5_9HEMI
MLPNDQAFTEVGMDDGSSSNESSSSDSKKEDDTSPGEDGVEPPSKPNSGGAERKKTWAELREIVNELRRNLSSLSTMVPTSISFRQPLFPRRTAHVRTETSRYVRYNEL